MMKLRFVVLVCVALAAFVGFSLVNAGTARAQTTDECVHQPTIASLEACVQHAADQGFIDNQGIANSLLAKLDAAQAAFDRGQTEVAIKNLEAFIHEVQAQAGKHIDQMHAEHLVMHAQMVIQALKNE
jgi:predicted negative regulator of RcsB-dependent stress response